MEDSSANPNGKRVDNDDDDVKILGSSKGKKQRTADAWKHFETGILDKDGNGHVVCKYCTQDYLYKGSNFGTSTLNRHLLVCKKKPQGGQIGAMFIDAEGKLNAKSKVIDQKICRDWMTKISVAHALPLKWVEYDKVRGFLKYLNSDIKFITRNTHASDVVSMYESEKEKLKLALKNNPGMLCLTSDVWTACTNSGYICLTAHYVDEKWRLNSKILAFCAMPPPHSGPELAQKIYDCLVDWGIDRKVFSLTLDNASANNVMVRMLKTRLNLQNSLLSNGDYFHVRCCAHILNLIVQDGLKVASDALDKIRGSIKYLKGSEARVIKFTECAQKVGIKMSSFVSMDVSTRWNSTYSMLASALKYRRVFCMLAFDDLAYLQCPSEEEWERGERMCEFLRPFDAMTTLISGSSYPTSNLYFMEVWKIARLLEKNLTSQDEVVKSMTILMKKKFDKYWEEYSEILAMGAVFDPRIKLKILEFCYSKVDPLSSIEKTNKLKQKLYTLYDEYKKKGNSASFKVPTSSSSSQVRECGSLEGGGQSTIGKGLNLEAEELVELRNYKGGTQGTKSLLDVYLEEDVLGEEDKIEVLKYWKMHATRFGELARMASDLLSIPITTVASESSFSIGAHVLNKYRNRLLPEKVQALICTRNWLHGYPDDDEDYEIEVNDQVEAARKVILVEDECHSSV